MRLIGLSNNGRLSPVGHESTAAWHSPARTNRRGLTLVECMWAITILPLAVAAIAFAIGAGQSQAFEAQRQMRIASLGEALMEEILSKPYADPQGTSAAGPESGETTRTLFDNADDYHNYSEAPGSLRDAAGNLYPQVFQGFGRSVTCQYLTVSVAAWSANVSGLSITITVTENNVPVTSMTRFLAAP